MKNGTTRLAYKHVHVVDMETNVILGVQVFQTNQHDETTILDSLSSAEENVASVGYSARRDEPFVGESWHREPLVEVVANKGYHKATTLQQLKAEGDRAFLPERKHRGRRHFVDKGGQETSRVFHENRARVRRKRGKDLQRQCGEFVERRNQHLFDRTGLRNLPLTGLENLRKHVLLQAAAFNLGAVPGPPGPFSSYFWRILQACTGSGRGEFAGIGFFQIWGSDWGPPYKRVDEAAWIAKLRLRPQAVNRVSRSG